MLIRIVRNARVSQLLPGRDRWSSAPEYTVVTVDVDAPLNNE